MPPQVEILRYAAFTSTPSGGNPAGVVLDPAGLSSSDMLAIAADVGYSETAFLTTTTPGHAKIRYWSPKAEVPFCGHATIATAVAYAERFGTGTLVLDTLAGEIPVVTRQGADGIVAELTSIEPKVFPLEAPLLAELLSALRWDPAELDTHLPPRIAFTGNYHPIIAARTRSRLANLDYDVDALTRLMARQGWVTIDLVYRDPEHPEVVHARNPFPPGGVYEDPATGAAATAFGGYLRELELVDTKAGEVKVTVKQGEDMGSPGTLLLTIPAAGGIKVAGSAVRLQ